MKNKFIMNNLIKILLIPILLSIICIIVFIRAFQEKVFLDLTKPIIITNSIDNYYIGISKNKVVYFQNCDSLNIGDTLYLKLVK